MRGSQGTISGGVPSEKTACIFNAPDHLAEAAHHMLVTETKNVNAQCAKSCVSLLIAKSCNLAGVRASIDFDSQPYLGTIEINDETANPVLPSELERFQIPQSGPESPLRECRFGSQPPLASVRDKT